MYDPHSTEPSDAGTDPPHSDPAHSEGTSSSSSHPEEEPTTTGTLFVMIVFLMALAGLWGIMYLQLLDR